MLERETVQGEFAENAREQQPNWVTPMKFENVAGTETHKHKDRAIFKNTMAQTLVKQHR